MKLMCWLMMIGFMFFYPASAHALYWSGGSGDGAALSAGDSRSWGFFGGSGRGEAQVLTGSQTLMTFTSSAEQTFFMGNSATAMFNIFIRQDTAVGQGVLAATGMKIVIPAGLAMSWDTTLTTAAITGDPLNKVSTTVSYPDSKTLLLTVNADFTDGYSFTVSGLKFKSFALTGHDFLRLDITGAGTVYDFDAYDKIIFASERTSGFFGGQGRGEVEGDIFLFPNNTADLGTLF